MTLRLRRLTLRVDTEQGPYVRDLRFTDGLTVVRGRNSRGKSTCLMSILYGLGLEGMLTAKRSVPLPHAVTEYLEGETGELRVVTSDVTLVIENGKKERLTVRRQIRGGADTRLIRTWRGEADPTSASAADSEDFFVRDSGAAQRDAGFHHMFARYLGWSLPEVPRFEGTPVPLYLEVIFPLLFIEQKRGWLGLQARMPTYLGIRDPQARAVEFLLGIAPSDAARSRSRWENAVQQAQEDWRRAHAAVCAAAKLANGDAYGVPSDPADPWPDAQPILRLPEGEEWVPIADAIKVLSGRLTELARANVPTAAENAEASTRELTDLEARLADLDALASRLDEDLEVAQLERASAEARLGALRRDLQRNRDAQKLRELGSMSRLNVVKDRCPTCHQTVTGHLLDKISLVPMSLEDNVAFIEEMLATVDAAFGEATRRVDITSNRIAVLADRRAAHRSRVRRLKRALVQDDRAPSLAEVGGRVRLEDDIERLKVIATRFADALRELGTAHDELARRRATLASIAKQQRTGEDLVKVSTLERKFVEQVAAYGLASLRDVKLSIDPNTFRPQAEGMSDLEFELSGSDLIRAIWAYYLALVETAREHSTQHPGLLVIDEPQQQGTEATAVGEMLRRAASAHDAGQQVIVASSEPQGLVQEQLHGLPFVEINLDTWALQKAPAA